jgi:hypothetical protein
LAGLSTTSPQPGKLTFLVKHSPTTAQARVTSRRTSPQMVTSDEVIGGYHTTSSPTWLCDC